MSRGLVRVAGRGEEAELQPDEARILVLVDRFEAGAAGREVLPPIRVESCRLEAGFRVEHETANGGDRAVGDLRRRERGGPVAHPSPRRRAPPSSPEAEVARSA